MQLIAADLALEAARVAARDHLAVVDDDDVVGQAVGLVEVLGREQERRALPHERVEHVPQVVAGARVEARRRLVEEHAPGAG